MADRPVVCDTSPLIKLAGVGLLELLPQLYGTIWLPEIVSAEYLVRATAPDPDLSLLPWISLHHVVIEPSLQALAGFGIGEAAVISLARACNARLVLVDDKRARRVASERGMVIAGTLAVLVRARQHGYLSELRPVLDTMVEQGRYISPSLRAQVLQAVGEEMEEES